MLETHNTFVHSSNQATEMEKGRSNIEAQLQQAKSEAKKLRDELNSTSSKLKQSQTQIDQLNMDKGAAMRNNASSYQQSIQLESQVLIADVHTALHVQQYYCLTMTQGFYILSMTFQLFPHIINISSH